MSGNGAEIAVTMIDDKDYISLTDMLKAKDRDFFISDWLRNRSTVEFLGIWEQIYKSGRYGGTYAYKDKREKLIVVISPQFDMALIWDLKSP